MITNYTNSLFCHSALDAESRFRLRGRNDKCKSFTLIELLVVLALVAILSVVVILTLNPAELIKQARDSNRLSDLSTINTSLNLFSSDVVNGFMGTSTIVYVSIPDSSAVCANLNLPSLPSGYTYNCVTSANLRSIDGTGWIPVNFQRISSNSPISQLPIDPINTTTTRLYYTYVAGGSWELNATIEASKNKLGGSGDLVSKDGGSATSQYEVGNNLNLNPVETGDTSLVGYWNFEEGTSATSTDRSGYGNNGTWYGTGTHYYIAGKVGSYSAQFNGSDDWISVPPSAILAASDITMLAWINVATPPATHLGIVTNKNSANYGINLAINSSANFESLVSDGSTATYFYSSSPGLSGVGIWHHTAVTHSSAGNNDIYYNGLYKNNLSKVIAYQASNDKVAIGAFYNTGSLKFNGYIDEVRIYNRVLSAAEILAIYNSTK